MKIFSMNFLSFCPHKLRQSFQQSSCLTEENHIVAFASPPLKKVQSLILYNLTFDISTLSTDCSAKFMMVGMTSTSEIGSNLFRSKPIAID